jgi:hypothetical protein
MAKKNVLTIRLPEDLKARLERTAALQGVSLNQLALYAFSRELAELEIGEFFRSRIHGVGRDEVLGAFDQVMNRISAAERLPAWDRLSGRSSARRPEKSAR